MREPGDEVLPEVLAEAQAELLKHTFDTFVSNPPSIAQGGKGVVVPGCPACKKRMQSMNQFMSHLADDVLPGILEKALAGVKDHRP